MSLEMCPCMASGSSESESEKVGKKKKRKKEKGTRHFNSHPSVEPQFIRVSRLAVSSLT